MVEIKQIQYKTYGKCLELNNGIVKLYITIDLGPRIINYSLVDGENMMLEDTEFSIFADGEDFNEYYGKGSKWYIYGGHRLWTSPESRPRSYYPDNTPVKYESIENGVRLVCDEQIKNQYQYTIDVVLNPSSSDVEVRHMIKNTGAFEVEFAAWALSVTAKGGMIAVPNSTRDTGLLANRVLAVWPYARMNDERVYWGDKYITLSQDPGADRAFKLGINNEEGYSMIFNHDCVFIKKSEHIEDAEYPDGGMSLETYTNKHFLEAETLSPLYLVDPGETIEHIEEWSLFGGVKKPKKNDEAAIAEIAAKYVK